MGVDTIRFLAQGNPGQNSQQTQAQKIPGAKAGALIA